MKIENLIASSLIKYKSMIAYYHASTEENSFSLELLFNTLDDAQKVREIFGRGTTNTISCEDNLDPEKNFVQLLIPNITGEEILSVMQANIIISPQET
jgi:hypothetical protein